MILVNTRIWNLQLNRYRTGTFAKIKSSRNCVSLFIRRPESVLSKKQGSNKSRLCPFNCLTRTICGFMSAGSTFLSALSSTKGCRLVGPVQNGAAHTMQAIQHFYIDRNLINLPIIASDTSKKSKISQVLQKPSALQVPSSKEASEVKSRLSGTTTFPMAASTDKIKF